MTVEAIEAKHLVASVIKITLVIPLAGSNTKGAMALALSLATAVEVLVHMGRTSQCAIHVWEKGMLHVTAVTRDTLNATNVVVLDGRPVNFIIARELVSLATFIYE